MWVHANIILMKKIYSPFFLRTAFVVLFMLSFVRGWGQATDLFFSEYVEGSSNNKYVEIYNGTGVSVNLSDYQIRLFPNGGTTANPTPINLSGTLTNGSVIVYKNSAATVYLGTATNNTSITFNGDDAIALYKISTTSYVDIVGNIGCDPGTGWTSATNSTLDKTLRRKSSICGGITIDPANSPCTFPTLEAEWDVYDIDVVSGLGSHTASCSSGATTITAGAGTEPATLSSLTTSLTGAVVPQQNAIVNFDFKIKDDGATAATDAVATKISQLVIGQGTGNDITNWIQAIAGAELSDGTNTATGSIATNSITFASVSNATGQLGYIADDAEKTYSLKIWLNTSLGGTLPADIDGKKFVFNIQNSGVTLGTGSSTLATSQTVSSATSENEVTVVATALNYTTNPSPTTINTNTNFTTAAVVKAQDANGNTDLGWNNAVTVGNSQSFTMANALTTFASGVLNFPTNFQFSSGGATPTVLTVDDADATTTNASYSSITVNVPIPAPEINIKTTASIATGGTHAFGNQVSGTSSTVVTFTIENTGTADLLLSGAPKIEITGSSEFTVNQTSTVSSVGAGSNTTFTVTFSPTTQGVKNAQLSIASNDADEASYIINLIGTGTVSTVSDIVIKAGYGYSQNILYANYQATDLTFANSIEIAQFTIRDGGATADADNLGTTLTRLDFNLTNGANIRRIAIYDGATEIAEQAGSTTHSFTNALLTTLTAADGGTKDFSIRVSFKDIVTDNQQIGITITATTTAANTGSTFANASAGGAATSNSSNNNRIEVVADRLAFVQQPTNTGNAATMSPAVTIRAIDVNSNIDLDFTSNVNVNCSTPTALTDNPVSVAAVAGLATYSSLVHTINGTYTMIGSSAGLTSTVASNSYIISPISYALGDYRTNPSFVGNIFFNSTTISGGLYPWQKWNGSNWIDVTGSSATASPQNLVTKPENIYLNGFNVDFAGGGTFNNIIVEGGYVYSGNTSTGLTIAANKTFDIKAGTVYVDGKVSFSAGSNIYVRSNALLEIGSLSTNFSRNITSTFTVEDLGFVLIDNYLANIWSGNENFSGESVFQISGWDGTVSLFDSGTAATTITNNSVSSKFGYLYVDLGTSGISGNWTYMFPSETFKLTNKDFELINSTSNNVSLNMSSMSIGGDFTVDGTGNIQGQTQAGTKTISVGGNFIKNGSGNFRLLVSGGAYVSILNVDGNFSVNDGFFVLDNNATGAATATVNLKGNLYKATGSYMTNANTNSNLVTFNFIGNSPQTVNLNVGAIDDMLRYKFFVKNGAYVKPITQDWKLATDAKITIENGGTLDFGFVASTPLNVITNGSQVGMTFNAQSGSILKITSPNGLNTSAPRSALGNVQTPVAGRTFDPGATYYYIGKSATPQVTGNAVAITTPVAVPLTGKIIVDMENGSGQFAASSERTISSPGTLEIIKGVVTDDSTNSFIGSGNVKMESANGKYITSKTGAQPSLTGTYTLTNGVVEFANSQTTKATIRVTPEYYNIDVSGSNVESGGKDLIINNLLKITKAGAILTIPEETDIANPYVVTAKKGIQVITGGKALFLNNANLIQDVDAINTGNINVQRKADVPSIQYNYWSSPVIGQKLYSLYDVPDNTVMTYNSWNDKFTILPKASNPSSVFAKGYSIKGSPTLPSPLIAEFVGTPNNETSMGINSITLSTAGSNYNLIGNPFPSNLNLLSLYGDAGNTNKFYNVTTGPDIETPTAYFWDNTSNGDLVQIGSTYAQNNYAVLNLSSGMGTSAPRFGTTGKKPNGIVKPGQGFIIRAAETGGSLTFKNSFRTTSVGTAGTYFKNGGKTTDKFWINLTTPNNMNVVIALAYNPEAENSFERFDSAILSDGVSENLYSFSSDSKKLAIQSRKGDFSDTDKISLGIKTSIAGTQKISIDEKLGVFENQPIYLKDNLLNMITDLSASTYEFTSSPGVDHNRFEIVFKPSGTLVTTNQQKGILEVYRSGEYFVVKSNDATIEEVEVYDAVGRLYQKVKGGTVEVKIDAAPLTNGLYVLKIKRNNETISKKIIK